MMLLAGVVAVALLSAGPAAAEPDGCFSLFGIGTGQPMKAVASAHGCTPDGEFDRWTDARWTCAAPDGTEIQVASTHLTLGNVIYEVRVNLPASGGLTEGSPLALKMIDKCGPPNRLTPGRWWWFQPGGPSLIVSANPNTNAGQALLRDERLMQRALALRAKMRAGVGPAVRGF